MKKRITAIIIAMAMILSTVGIIAESAGTAIVYADTKSANAEEYEYIMTVDPIPDQEFDWKAVCPVPNVRVNGILLDKSQYEIVKYTDNTAPGFGLVEVKLILNESLYKLLGITEPVDADSVISGFNTISESAEFKILQPETEDPNAPPAPKTLKIYGVKHSYQWKGEPIEPEITVQDGDKVLTEGVHYVVKYGKITDVNCTTSVEAIGIGEYKGIKAIEWYQILFKYGRHIYRTRVLSTPVYTGSAIVPEVEVLGNFTKKEGEHLTDPYPLKEGVDYIVVATNNVNAGSKAQYTIKGIGDWLGVELDPNDFTIAKRNVKGLKVTGVTDKVYTGKAVKQKNINMYLGKKKLVKGKDYTVTYKNNVKCGKATVTIKGKGLNFTGTKTITFNIYPRKVKNVKVTAGNNSATVKFNKNYGAVTGYQVRYAANEKFNGYKAKNTSKTSVKIAKLGDKKVYYVKVRAYKVINGKKVFGNWSDVKRVKTK